MPAPSTEERHQIKNIMTTTARSESKTEEAAAKSGKKLSPSASATVGFPF